MHIWYRLCGVHPLSAKNGSIAVNGLRVIHVQYIRRTESLDAKWSNFILSPVCAKKPIARLLLSSICYCLVAQLTRFDQFAYITLDE